MLILIIVQVHHSSFMFRRMGNHNDDISTKSCIFNVKNNIDLSIFRFSIYSISYTSQNLRKFLSSVSIRLTSSFDSCFAISIEARFSFIRVSFSVFVTTARPLARAYPMHTWAAVHPILAASFVITGSSNTKEMKWYFYFPTRYITI